MHPADQLQFKTSNGKEKKEKDTQAYYLMLHVLQEVQPNLSTSSL